MNELVPRFSPTAKIAATGATVGVVMGMAVGALAGSSIGSYLGEGREGVGWVSGGAGAASGMLVGAVTSYWAYRAGHRAALENEDFEDD